MASKKGKSKNKGGASAAAAKQSPDLMRPALDAFARGAYDEARTLFASRASATDASDSERKMAERFASATRFERGTLLAGLACLGLYLLVIAVTLIKQP